MLMDIFSDIARFKKILLNLSRETDSVYLFKKNLATSTLKSRGLNLGRNKVRFSTSNHSKEFFS